jgi:hypothetical protein
MFCVANFLFMLSMLPDRQFLPGKTDEQRLASGLASVVLLPQQHNQAADNHKEIFRK